MRRVVVAKPDNIFHSFDFHLKELYVLFFRMFFCGIDPG